MWHNCNYVYCYHGDNYVTKGYDSVYILNVCDQYIEKDNK